MNTSGDAAEQIVRMSLEGTEVALKLTGSAAKNIAAAIYSIYKNRDKNKTKGKQRLTSMLKSGKELKVFTISEEHLAQFAVEAKRYGVVYCALRGKEKPADGMVDVMVRAEDASKINRIVERFKLSTVDAASIKSDIERKKTDKSDSKPEPERTAPDKGEEALLDDLLSKPSQKEKAAPEDPAATKTDFFQERTAKSGPSGNISGVPDKTAVESTKPADRPSVREEIKNIRSSREAKRKEAPEAGRDAAKNKPSKTVAPEHNPKRKKSKKNKER